MVNNANKIPVLIAGAGPSGLVLALTLAINGVPVRIIEKELSPGIGQRGAGIQPRSIELLRFLGVLPEILKRAIPCAEICEYKMPDGVEPEKKFNFLGDPWEPTPDIPYPNVVILGQSNYEGIFRDRLATLGVQVEFGTELADFEQDHSGVTAIVVRHGNNLESHTETIFADWLVSAEGGHSHTRKKLGLNFLGETRDAFRVLITDAELSGLSREYWHSWGAFGDTSVMLRPTEDPKIFSIVIVAPPPELMTRAQEGHDGFVEVLHKITNRKDIRIGKIVWQTEWRPNIRIVDKYYKGRVFLVGDAAHTHSPTGGQGANTGMQDGANLGWKLSLVHKGLASPPLLDTYHEERHPVAKDMLARTTSTLDELIDMGAKKDMSPVTQGILFKQLKVNYRWSSIVVDQQPRDVGSDQMAAYLPQEDTELRAGDRAPDAPGLVPLQSGTLDRNAATSLFDIFCPTYHTLLLFEPAEGLVGGVEHALASLPQELFRKVLILSPGTTLSTSHNDGSGFTVLVDTDGHASAAYHPTRRGFSLIVVRPDGAIGAILKDVEGLQRYLGGIFKV
ncbi:monooxygenase [Irpex lacteus]|nr:monooxygenase [Irpex lacteus]